MSASEAGPDDDCISRTKPLGEPLPAGGGSPSVAADHNSTACLLGVNVRSLSASSSESRSLETAQPNSERSMKTDGVLVRLVAPRTAARSTPDPFPARNTEARVQPSRQYHSG